MWRNLLLPEALEKLLLIFTFKFLFYNFNYTFWFSLLLASSSKSTYCFGLKNAKHLQKNMLLCTNFALTWHAPSWCAPYCAKYIINFVKLIPNSIYSNFSVNKLLISSCFPFPSNQILFAFAEVNLDEKECWVMIDYCNIISYWL